MSISANTIKTALFSIFFLGGNAGTIKTAAYRITNEWNINEATWLNAKNGEKWYPQSSDYLKQGGAYTTQDSAETPYAAENTWESYNITNIVKYLITNPTANYGFLIINDEYNGNTNRPYVSSDYQGDPSLRPKLTITYETAITFFPKIGIKSKINFQASNTAIKFTIPFNKCIVTISSVKGQRIMRLEGNHQTNFEIPLNKLSTGIHFLNIRHENVNESLKFIVSK